jgi:hypothetical protein
MTSYKEALAKHYNQLVGFTVVDVFILEEEQEISELEFYPRVGIIFQKGKNQLLVEVLSDEEGNGLGYLDIMEMEKNDSK